MKRTILAAIVAALTAAAPVMANYVIVGPTPLCCGGWESAKENVLTGRGQYIGWVWGFLSGLETATGLHKLETTDTASITAWMDNYCANNRLQSLDAAAVVLWRHLAESDPLSH
jgi:hypothetical protein